MAEWAVVLFRSTHLAVRAERAAQQAGIDAKLIPAPRDLSHDCGVALRIPRCDVSRVEEAFKESRVDYERTGDLNW